MILISMLSRSSMISLLLTIAVVECQLCGAGAIHLKKAFPAFWRRLRGAGRSTAGAEQQVDEREGQAIAKFEKQAIASFAKFEKFMRAHTEGKLDRAILEGIFIVVEQGTPRQTPVSVLDLTFYRPLKNLFHGVNLTDEGEEDYVRRHVMNIRRFLTYGNEVNGEDGVSLAGVRNNIQYLDEVLERLNSSRSQLIRGGVEFADLISIYRKIKIELLKFEAALDYFFDWDADASLAVFLSKEDLDIAARECITKQAQDEAAAMERASPEQERAASEDDFKFDAPNSLKCPITQELMKDPVMTSDGHTYERAAITQWLENHETSPLTNERLANNELIPNIPLKNVIHELRAGDAPDSLKCPIIQELMLMDSQTYERAVIEKWFENHNTSPQTGSPLENKELIPNFALRQAIDELREIRKSQREHAST